jgi:large subunit ribosomal protein L3
MVGIIGKKVGMTRVYGQTNRSVPCTVVQAGPCVVTQVRSIDKDGYKAVQLGYEDKKVKNTSRALERHFEKAATTPKRKLIEFKEFLQTTQGKQLALGDQITLQDLFAEGDLINVSGVSKGKGYQGVVKRHHFSGVGERTHGQQNRERAPGSVGPTSGQARVHKNKRMAGRMGNDRVKVKNLRIIKIIPEEHLLLLSGPVPGAKNGYLTLQK